MGCDEYSANVQLYIDKELKDQALEEFQTHLENCPDCRKEVEEAEKLLELLHRSRPLYPASDTLRRRIMEATAKPQKDNKGCS